MSATDLSKKLGISIGYPYLSLKYGFTPKLTGEIRGAFGEGISVLSGRGYYNFYSEEKILGYVGGDLGYITFDTEEISGNGYLGMVFIGGEYFINPKLSFGLDIGPAYISLRTTEIGKDFTVGGIEWVCNLCINYYFNIGGKKRT